MNVLLAIMLVLLLAPAQAPATNPPPAGAGEGSCADAGCHAGLAGKATVHPPAADGGCEMCHEHRGGSEHGFRLASEPVTALCATCHDMPSGEGVEVHGAIEAGECTACHDPHASDNASLLVAEPPDLCLTCHDDPRAAGKNVHGAIEAGGCTACHDPHGSRHGPLLVAAVPDLCLECHEDPRKGGEVVHAAAEEGDCMLCHTPHASDHRKLAREEIKDLCTTCHTDQGEALGKPVVHGVIGSVGCSACHNPHSASVPRLLRAVGIDLCTPCHVAGPSGGDDGRGKQATLFGTIDVDGAWLAGLPKIALSDGAGHPVGRHPVSAASDPRDPNKPFWCVSCHEPHASDRAKLLAGPGGMGLCTQCHKK